MKKFLSVILILLCIVSGIAFPTFSKPGKGNSKHTSPPPPTPSQDAQLFFRVYGMDQTRINYFTRFNFSSDELSLVLYLYSVSGRPVNESELIYIQRNRNNWPLLTWRFGLPPIMMEEGIFRFRHPMQVRHYPPIDKEEYNYAVKGKWEEKVEVKKDKYEYHYKNKSLGMEEKLEVTRDKYEYRYKDRTCEETLEIKYPSYRYKYRYKDHRNRTEIKKEGIGSPITPVYFYQRLKQEQKGQPELHFGIQINIKL